MNTGENYGRGFDLVDEAGALRADLHNLPERMEEVRRAEARIYEVYRDAKEGYDLTVSNEMLAHQEQLGGSNAETRKANLEAFLVHNTAICTARQEVNAAEGRYLDAQIETKRVADTMAAVRNSSRLLSALLEFVASENNIDAADSAASSKNAPAF